MRKNSSIFKFSFRLQHFALKEVFLKTSFFKKNEVKKVANSFATFFYGALLIFLNLYTFILFLATPIQACASSSTSSARTAISSAENLMLKKDRIKALQILNETLSNSDLKLSSEDRKKIVKKVKQLSVLFITEKGQKLFEHAKSLYPQEPAAALRKTQEALIVEPAHEEIQSFYIQLLISNKDCTEAKNRADEALTLNPLSDVIWSQKYISLVCLKDNEEAEAIYLKRDQAWRNRLEVFAAKMESVAQSQKWEELKSFIERRVKQFPNFSEAFYWLDVSTEKLGLNNFSAAQKYLSLCSSAKDEKEIKRPNLLRDCENILEITESLKKRSKALEEQEKNAQNKKKDSE